MSTELSDVLTRRYKCAEICYVITYRDAKLAALDGKDVQNYLLELIRDYFKDRVLIYDKDYNRKSYVVSARVPQVSVLGSILWNVMYDGVLRLNLSKSSWIIGFKDDIALVI